MVFFSFEISYPQCHKFYKLCFIDGHGHLCGFHAEMVEILKVLNSF